MPIDYKKYPKNWLSEIRPRILRRAKNQCEFCGVKNHKIIYRGYYNNIEVYRDADGNIFDASNSNFIEKNQSAPIKPLTEDKTIKVVLTIAHLNHNINDNRDENLRALCQRCHLRHDGKQHAFTRKHGSMINQLKLWDN